MSKIQSFLEAFRPFVIASHFLGVNQFSMSQNYKRDGKIVWNRFNYITFVLIAIIYVVAAIMQTTFLLGMLEYPETTVVMGICSSFSLLYMYCMDLKNRRKVALIISRLHGVDCLVRQYELKIVHNNSLL